MIPDDDLSTELVLKIARRAGRLSLPSKRSLHVHDQNKNRHNSHSTAMLQLFSKILLLFGHVCDAELTLKLKIWVDGFLACAIHSISVVFYGHGTP